MKKMSSLAFPDGSVYEVWDEKARAEAEEIKVNMDTVKFQKIVKGVRLRFKDENGEDFMLFIGADPSDNTALALFDSSNTRLWRVQKST